MSGHSKWSTIKRKKGAADAKKGKIFSKVVKEITIAARIGGGDPSCNSRLRAALDKAKASNMPQDNIARAIKKGTGDLEGVSYEEITYEAYGPSGVALLIQALTDNKNRTVAEVKHLLTKYGGSMGASGCVAWIFESQGVISFNKEDIDENKLMEVALEAGADDIRDEDVGFDVITTPENYETVKAACEKSGLKFAEAELAMVPQNTVKLSGKDAERTLKLMEALEDNEDIQNIYANFDIDTKEMEDFV
ncbi:YebC/PmpR family DNA-binding transcriptional regulator [bacterium]|nr:YebC/PmpR family DNA-binding transcriptional regulator [bacterium]